MFRPLKPSQSDRETVYSTNPEVMEEITQRNPNSWPSREQREKETKNAEEFSRAVRRQEKNSDYTKEGGRVFKKRIH